MAAGTGSGLRYEGFKLFQPRSIVHRVRFSRSKTPTNQVLEFLVASNGQTGQVAARAADASLCAGGIALGTGEMPARVKHPFEVGTEESLSAEDAAFL